MANMPYDGPIVVTMLFDAEITHGGGRRCTLRSLDPEQDKVWAYFDGDDHAWYACPLEHPRIDIRKKEEGMFSRFAKKARGEQPPDLDDPTRPRARMSDHLTATEGDRGEFGMPTLGSTGAGFDVTHAPDDDGYPPADVTGVPWNVAPARVFPAPEEPFKMTVTRNAIDVNYGRSGYMTQAETDDARYILDTVLPGLLSRFLTKNSKYALAQDIDLGVKGIVPDINRKASVIINRLWHGNGMVDEDTEEVIDDLIGHLLLMRAKMRTM